MSSWEGSRGPKIRHRGWEGECGRPPWVGVGVREVKCVADLPVPIGLHVSARRETGGSIRTASKEQDVIQCWLLNAVSR